MPSPARKKQKRVRRWPLLTVSEIAADEQVPACWGRAVKVQALELRALREDYELRHGQAWKADCSRRKAAKAAKAARSETRQVNKRKRTMRGIESRRRKNLHPFVSEEEYDAQSEKVKTALFALYEMAPKQSRLRGRCGAILPVLRLIGSGYLWTLIEAEVLAEKKFAPETILYKVSLLSLV